MLRPARGVCLVRKVETEETLPGGRIYIPSAARERLASYQVQIVAVGAPEICERPDECERVHDFDLGYRFIEDTEQPTLDVHPIDERIEPNAWAVVQPRSFIDAGHPTERLYFVRQSDILGVFRVGD